MSRCNIRVPLPFAGLGLPEQALGRFPLNSGAVSEGINLLNVCDVHERVPIYTFNNNLRVCVFFCFSQILVIVDAKPKALRLPTDAYYAVEEVHDVSIVSMYYERRFLIWDASS